MNKVALVQELVKIAKSLVSAPRESFEVIVDYISMQTAEDTWEQGEIGHARVVLVQGNAGTFKTIALAVKKASEITGIPEKNFALFEGDEGRIEGQGLVDENNFYVGDDKRFLAEFKAGRVKAWNADVSVRVRFAKVWTPTIQEMKAVSNLGTI